MDDRVLAMLGDREAAERLTEAGVLLPCPGCKSESVDLVSVSFDQFWIMCRECGWEGPYKADSKSATSAWNRRSTILTPTQLALLRIAEEPRKFEEG